MTISKGRGTHVKLIVLLRQSDFYCSGHQAGPSINICCRVRRRRTMKRTRENISSPPPFFLHVPCRRRNTQAGANGRKSGLTRVMRASGRGRDRPDLRRSLLPCTHHPRQFIPRSRREERTQEGSREEDRKRKTAEEWTRSEEDEDAARETGVRECVECAAGTPFLYASHFLRLNETR